MNEIRSVQIQCPLCGSTAHVVETLLGVDEHDDPAVVSGDPECTNADCPSYRP